MGKRFIVSAVSAETGIGGHRPQAQASCVFYSRDGKTHKHKNMGWIRRVVGRELVGEVSIHRLAGGRGQLRVFFANGGHYFVAFASYRVLCGALLRWRNLYSVRLRIGGKTAGFVDPRHSILVESAYP